MTTRTFSGGIAGGIQFPDRFVRFGPGETIEVTDDEATILDESPEWNPDAPVVDDLSDKDKDALLQIAEDESLDVNKRLGVDRLADDIRSQRAALTEGAAHG